MNRATGLRHPGAGRGFTLIEVLLALVLVMLMLGALVFSFSSGQQQAELDEGATQVENLLRFARAHSANIGRQVQLRLEVGDFGDFELISTGNLLLQWEPDPLGQPGSLEEVTEARSLLRSISELVQVETMKGPEAGGLDVGVAGEQIPAGPAEAIESAATAAPVIVFYPDGSSDSAEIVLNSRLSEDTRRVVIQLSGITGSIRRRWVSSSDAQPEPDSPDKSTEGPASGAELLPSPKLDANPM